MDAGSLQDRIDRGMGSAARAIGVPCDAYRPAGPVSPLASSNRFLRIHAAFNAQDMRFATAGLPIDPVWYGVFDAAYLQPGDYLVERKRAGRTWFVGGLQPLLPPLVVLTNSVVCVSRAAGGAQPGAVPYGAGGSVVAVVQGFPASLLHGGGGRGSAALPADARPGDAVALLPAIPSVTLARGDTVRDETGRGYVVGLAEANGLGWRLELRQAAS